jgi:hypothetical protein
VIASESLEGIPKIQNGSEAIVDRIIEHDLESFFILSQRQNISGLSIFWKGRAPVRIRLGTPKEGVRFAKTFAKQRRAS